MLCSRGVVTVAALLALAGCNGSGNGGMDATLTDGGTDAADVWTGDLGNPSMMYPVPTCASANQAPLPDGVVVGGFTCETVGPAASSGTALWPDTSTLTGPFVYVNAAAAAGGDGRTQATAFQTIEAGVNPLTTAATVVVARGDYTPAVTIMNTVPVTIVGVGASGGTVIHPMVAGVLFNPSADLDLRAMQIGDGTARPGNGIAVTAHALALHDVAIQHVATAVVVTGGVLTAVGVSIQHTIGSAIELHAHATATVSQYFASDVSIGVMADASSLSITDALVTGATRTGIALLPGSNDTSAHPSHIERVALVANTNAGLRIDGADRVVDVLNVMVAGTTAPPSGLGGDGVFVTNGAHVNFDVSIATEARMGLGSQYRSNDRIGLFAAGGNVEVHGGLFGSNHGAGLLMQDSAQAGTIGFSVFQQNAGAGTMVASMSTVGILVCNDFVGNQRGTLSFTNGAVEMQDGLVMDPGGSGMVSVLDNTFFANGRYGAIIVGLSCTLEGNRFVGNQFNYGAFNTMVTTSASAPNTLSGGAMTPSNAPLASAPDGIALPAF